MAGHEDPARAAQVERARKRRVVAGVQVEAIDQLQLIGIGLLDAVDPIDLRQLRQQVGRHVRGRASRDVVDERGFVGRPRHRLVVALEPEAAGLVVVGRHRQHGVSAELGGALGQEDGMARVVGARSRHDRGARRPLGDREPDESQLLLIGQRRGLARRARHDEAVRAVIGEVAHQRHERLLVDPPLLVEGRDDRRQDAAETEHALQYLTRITVPAG